MRVSHSATLIQIGLATAENELAGAHTVPMTELDRPAPVPLRPAVAALTGMIVESRHRTEYTAAVSVGFRQANWISMRATALAHAGCRYPVQPLDRVMSDNETIDVYDAQIDRYADLVRPDSDNPELLSFIRQLRQGGQVLDLGCGPAHDAAVMRAHGLEVDAVDGSAEMVRFANETYQLNARQALFEEIDERHRYDGIWANFSLLHASAEELPGLLQRLHTAIKPGGVFHLAMKIGDGAKRDRLGRYYSYYTEPQLKAVLTTAGFAVHHTTHGEARGLAGDIEPWIILVGIAQ